MPSRGSTSRDYRERVNRVIFHVEAHLDQTLTVHDLAAIAHFSPFHFHRLFAAFAGEPLAAFIRRLRLERAAQHLLHLDASITQIASAAGYDSPSAFARSFSAHFGLSPTSYRRQHEPITLLGAKPLALTFTSEEIPMNPEIRTVDPMPVLFVRRTGPYDQAAAEAFDVLCQFAGPRGLLGPTEKMIGISHDDPHVTDRAKLRYDACVTVGHPVDPEGDVGVKTLAGGSYAVFLHEGSYDLLQGTYDRIFTAWLPASGRTLRDEPCFELYLNSPGEVSPEDLRTEIWLPIHRDRSP